jgi:DNA topoisomerase-3
VIGVVQTRVDALRTTPPPRFTEGSLKNIMKHAYRLVADPAERKRLKLAEGIGTAATRIPMVKMLIKRGLIVKKGSHLLPSAMASLLVRAVPTMMTSPGLTAQWESALDLVHQGKLPLATFEQKQQQFVQALLQQIKTKPLPVIPAAVMEEQAKEAAKRGFAPRPTGPAATPIGPKPDGEGKTCEKCKKGKMVAKTVQKEGPNRGKQFLSCDNYPKCKNMEWPK